jgi:chromate transporter
MEVRKIRYFIFLRDVAWLAVTAFGGPQVHLTLFLELLVKQRRYLTEQEFWELHALCQILPGPTSSQTIVTIGFRLGEAKLAYLTLLIWCLPGVLMMTIFGILVAYLHAAKIPLDFMYVVQPMAIGFMCHAAFSITRKIVNTKTGYTLMVLALIVASFVHTPWVFPITVIVGGIATSFKFKEQEKEEKTSFKIQWANFFLFAGVGLGLAIAGHFTKFLWVRMSENFYRNGSFVYGGGQVLIPVLFTEFVRFKERLTQDEFLSGYGLVQLVPGPVFSFASFLGVLTMREYGLGWQIAGGILASVAIFLPGAFIMFFAIRIWEHLKRYRVVKASIEGINAASAGLVIAGALTLVISLEDSWYKMQIVSLLSWDKMFFVTLSFLLLQFTKISRLVLILSALLIGLAYQFAK